jgi:hypothetical protein
MVNEFVRTGSDSCSDYCHTSVDTEIYRDWWVKERKRDDRDRDIGRGIDMDIIYR